MSQDNTMPPLPEGYLFFGKGPVPGHNFRSNPDVATIVGNKWITSHVSGESNMHTYALRAWSPIAIQNRLFPEGTALWYLAQLPEPLAGEAVSATLALMQRRKEGGMHHVVKSSSMAAAIISGFSWSESPSGSNFWSKVHEDAGRGKYDPPPKPVIPTDSMTLADYRQAVGKLVKTIEGLEDTIRLLRVHLLLARVTTP